MFHGKGEEPEPGMFIPLSLNFANAGEIPVKLLMNDGHKSRARNGQNGVPMDHSMHGSTNGAYLTDHLMHEMGAIEWEKPGNSTRCEHDDRSAEWPHCVCFTQDLELSLC